MDKERQEFQYDEATKEHFQAEQLRKKAGMKESDVEEASEEYAAELMPSISSAGPLRSEPQADVQSRTASPSRTIGYVAILAAISSLFVWPVLLGPTAAVLGFFAFIRGSRALGAWSIILGLIAVAAYFILIPFYA